MKQRPREREREVKRSEEQRSNTEERKKDAMASPLLVRAFPRKRIEPAGVRGWADNSQDLAEI